jgi:hypothetical protein
MFIIVLERKKGRKEGRKKEKKNMVVTHLLSQMLPWEHLPSSSDFWDRDVLYTSPQ